ncbi:hypothetical protein ACJJTC_004772 [Scirpophaga incertulas]
MAVKSREPHSLRTKGGGPLRTSDAFGEAVIHCLHLRAGAKAAVGHNYTGALTSFVEIKRARRTWYLKSICTYFGLEYGDDGDIVLWFLFGCVCLFAFVSRPPPGDILPASAFSECSIAGGGRFEQSDLVTLMPRLLVVGALRRATVPYLLIRGAGAYPPPASSPPDTLTRTITDVCTNSLLINSHLEISPSQLSHLAASVWVRVTYTRAARRQLFNKLGPPAVVCRRPVHTVANKSSQFDLDTILGSPEIATLCETSVELDALSIVLTFSAETQFPPRGVFLPPRRRRAKR